MFHLRVMLDLKKLIIVPQLNLRLKVDLVCRYWIRRVDKAFHYQHQRTDASIDVKAVD